MGDYIIHRQIGHGGMGEIYEAEEQLTHRRVAIKLLHAELAQTPQGRRQFVSEMSILASLDDPHVVRCLHCTEIDGQLIMVLEYLEGRTLRDVLKQRGALPWPEVASIAWQIAAALRAAQAHRPAIVHRDLKPENTMCLPDGRVKVMDFGIAKILETLVGTTTSASLGTLQYMSPEQIDAKPVDGRSDLFSLGLVMWELLVGRPPFVADSPRLLLDKLCTEPTPPLPDAVRQNIPANLEWLIGRLLQKDPHARPRDANEVIAALDAMRYVQPPVVAPAVAPAPAPAPAPVPAAVRQPSLNTVAIVERASNDRGSRWLLPVAITGGVAILAIAVVAWVHFDPLADDARDSQASVSSKGATKSTVTSPPTKDPRAPAECLAQASRWQGTWTLHTIATAATNASWIGGKGTYELTLEVEGCRLAGTGHKLIRGEKSRFFEATGEVADDGTATLRYQVTGRAIAGTWTLAKDGTGTWSTADSSGTLTADR
jgi:tRNA A-37 threonylcarbamoyl transferase component Bud32